MSKRRALFKEVESVHNAHMNADYSKSHVYLKDGTSLNFNGTIHDKFNGIPVLSKKAKKWLKKYGKNWKEFF